MKISRAFVFIFPVVLQWTNAHAATPAVCDGTGLCSVVRSLKTDSGEARNVSYSFRYRAPQAGAPTVIYIPGGPGGTSTDKDIAKLNSIPAHFGLIQTDPRFTGVNERGDVGQFRQALTSDGVANDIALALDSVGVRNPVIYGTSYGTVVATMLANSLSQKPGLAPRAVVLDGTFAHSESQTNYINGLLREWKKIAESAPPEDLKAYQDLSLKMIRDKMLTADQIGSAMMGLLMARRQGDLNLMKAVFRLARREPDRAANVLVDIAGQMDQIAGSPGAKLFHGVVACRELMPEGSMDKADLTFNFDLRESPGSDCGKYAKPGNLFDSKDYPIKDSTIIYLVGSNDPVTPREHTEYHARFQVDSKKIQIIVPDAGHSVLPKEFLVCARDFWRAIETNPADAARRTTRCAFDASPGGESNRGAVVR